MEEGRGVEDRRQPCSPAYEKKQEINKRHRRIKPVDYYQEKTKKTQEEKP